MGQLVHLAVKCKRQVVIPRCIYQQDLPTLGIHYRQDVHIAAALSIDIGITLITAAAVDHEGVLGDGAGRLDGCDLMLGDILIEDTGTVRKILVVLLLRQQGDIPLIENDGLHLVIIESVCHGRGGFIFRGFYFTHAFLHGRQDLLGVRLVPVGQNAKAVALGITQLCGIVLFHDDDCCHLFFNHDAGNLAQSVLHGACRHSAVDHNPGQHHCQNAADQLADLVASQGQLHKDVQSVDHKQCHHYQHQIGGGEHLGAHKPGKNGQAAYEQRAHHCKAEPIQPSAAVCPAPIAFLLVFHHVALLCFRIPNVLSLRTIRPSADPLFSAMAKPSILHQGHESQGGSPTQRSEGESHSTK